MAVHPGITNDDVVGTDLLTVSAEGRVEHQKLNQTAPQGVVYTVFRARCHLQFRSTVDSASKQENFAHVFVHYLG